jgi:hypothetical protein
MRKLREPRVERRTAAPDPALVDLLGHRPTDEPRLAAIVARNAAASAGPDAVRRGMESMRSGQAETAYAYFRAADHFQSPYAELWQRWLRRIARWREREREPAQGERGSQYQRELELLRQPLLGKTLVDLGSAREMMMAPVARVLGVSRYLAVDSGFRGSQPQDPTVSLAGQVPMPDTEHLVEALGLPAGAPDKMAVVPVQADMLDFLSRVNDNAVSISLNGIDTFIAPDAEYQQALADQIVRTLEPGGIVLGTHSEAFDLIEDRPELDEIFAGSTFPDARVFKKK